ncbi:M61 family metallopeptidase [Thiocystis violacea]|uniref:M61 family metallopeptidase n=1 Tax=Thiocystis violacea TaxID=13725 RepID=UPI001904B074|nr:PDZ domain-containing protein [Thiocystis violacea]MBK1721688.1 peptidase M61 [Thiocystis violacea]
MSDATPGDPGLVYRVRPLFPRRHLFAVELSLDHRLILDHSTEGRVALSMPAWIPGSYMIRDFARNLVAIAAEDLDGRPLELAKEDKQTWVCRTAAGLRVSYEVFAWELSVRSAHLDLTHAYFNGASLLLKVDGCEDRPCRLELLPPEDESCQGWRVASSLRPTEVTSAGFGRYQADSYQDLIDHPVEMGVFTALSFEVGGIAHRIAVTGARWFDEDRLTRDLSKICAEHAALFGELPVDRYLFLVTALGEGYGGLEHAFSTSLICCRDDMPVPGEALPSKEYNRFLGLCSHEYFHLWMVKRIRPLAFIAGGLEHEVHTRLLWAFEGITSYYDELALARSGCIDHKTYLGLLAETITRVIRTPGRRLQTVAESSFDAWTKFYKQDENAPNAIVSYYAKGALVALALDLLIRRETSGAQSLDDVMRGLWQRHGRLGVGVPERGVEAVAMEATGLDLRDFFARALDSTEDLDLPALLATVGVEMRLRSRQGAKDMGGCVDAFEVVPSQATLDLRLRPGTAEAVVQSVITAGAGEQAGIAPGDVIIAVDGLRATPDTLDRLIARSAARSGEVEVHLFRRDELLRLIARPQAAPDDTCELRLASAPPECVARARAAWLASVG